jgi:RNA polymerase sigma-70 factor, ECF subfamily
MDDADERLQIEAAQQDPAKFGDVYERHFERVYAFVIGRVRDRAVAEDITAEVFHRALAALPKFQFRGESKGPGFAAWLLRIAANAVIDRTRRAGREVSIDDGGTEPSVLPVQPPDRREAVFRLVNDLPVDQRRVVVERFVEERSIKEIAGRLNRTEGAVKQLQFRALQTLRARIEDGDA